MRNIGRRRINPTNSAGAKKAYHRTLCFYASGMLYATASMGETARRAEQIELLGLTVIPLANRSDDVPCCCAYHFDFPRGLAALTRFRTLAHYLEHSLYRNLPAQRDLCLVTNRPAKRRFQL